MRIIEGADDFLEDRQESGKGVAPCVENDNREGTSGKPLLMLHVLIGSNECIAALIEEVKQCPIFQTSRVDLPHGGHGVLC